MLSIFWLPEGSPWAAALGRRLPEPDWVTMDVTQYGSQYTRIAGGFAAWLDGRERDFRREVQRRARRAADEGFRLVTTEEHAGIMAWLPAPAEPVRRAANGLRGGEGYRFDGDMVKAIGEGLELSSSGRFALSMLERDGLVIGSTLSRRAGTRMTCWITGYDPEWSRLGPGLASLLESIDACRETSETDVSRHRRPGLSLMPCVGSPWSGPRRGGAEVSHRDRRPRC